MRSWLIGGTALTAALMVPILGSVSAQPDAQARRGPGPREGLCRNAPTLAVLPPERRWDPQQQDRRSRYGGAREEMAMSDASGLPPPPAPPPPPSVAPSPVMAPPPSGITTTARRAEPGKSLAAEAESARIMPPYPPRPPYPQPQPQAGLLTAGEHDDLLNPELYARYVQRSDLGQKIRDLPRVDTGRVLTVTVKDRGGQPVPFARVTLTCADGNTLSLATQADGKVVFFPALDRLGRSVSIGVPGAASRSVTLSDAPGGQDVGVTLNQTAPAVRKFDLALVIDTTGSMGDEIRYLQSELRAIVDRLKRSHPQLDMQIGFVFYRDEGDDYVTLTHPLSRDFGRQQSVLAQQSAGGGGDYPEAMDQALIRAAGLAWRPDAIKSMLLVADAPAHDDKVGRAWAAAEAARARRVHIVPVAASGVADEAEYAMRAMAAATQSRYLFLTDDSGIGNPHVAPAIDCYLVTRLDSAVRRVLDSQISGRRIEPDRQEVIRQVGDYDAGRCVLPRDWRGQN